MVPHETSFTDTRTASSGNILASNLRNCPHCKQDFTSDHPRRKFCSVKCRTRCNAKVSYDKNKNDPVWKEGKRKYLQKWIVNNRPRFNALANKATKKYQKKIALIQKGERDEAYNKLIKKTFKKEELIDGIRT